MVTGRNDFSEITAFRRRVTIAAGDDPGGESQNDGNVCLSDAGTGESIEPESDEGRRILLEAVRLMEEKLAAS